MICPSCSEYITEDGLIKSKVKKWGNTDIEYEARCPSCSVHIGTMFWGKLTLTEELQRRLEQNTPPLLISADDVAEAEAASAADPFDEEPIFHGMDYSEQAGTAFAFDDYKQDNSFGYYPPEQMSGHYCPHCGGDLPNNIDLLPKKFR